MRMDQKFLGTEQVRLHSAFQNFQSEWQSLMGRTMTNYDGKSTWIDRRHSDSISMGKKRWTTTKSRGLYKTDQLSNVNNFNKFFDPEVNSINNSIIWKSATKKRTQSTIVDIEQGIPRSCKPSGVCSFVNFIPIKAKWTQSNKTSQYFNSFLNEWK